MTGRHRLRPNAQLLDESRQVGLSHAQALGSACLMAAGLFECALHDQPARRRHRRVVVEREQIVDTRERKYVGKEG